MGYRWVSGKSAGKRSLIDCPAFLRCPGGCLWLGRIIRFFFNLTKYYSVMFLIHSVDISMGLKLGILLTAL